MPSAKRRVPGWRPVQHGAWFMLALPVLTGAVVRLRTEQLPTHTWWLAGCWVAGYLAFNAASVWLKSPPSRRPAVQPALITYAGLTLCLGVVVLALAGVAVLWWLVPFAPLAGCALALAAGRRDRSLASGALTVAAASLMTLVVRYDSPGALVAAPRGGPVDAALVATGLVFAYLFGTVLYVKTMIRERGDRRWVVASAAWHGAATAAAAALAGAGLLGTGWTVFFLATLARSLAMPAIAGRRPVRPMAVGLVEVGFSAAFAALVLVTTG